MEGEEALAWVEARNAETLAELGAHPWFQTLQEDILEIGQEIQKKPDTAWDRARELSDLKDELEQEGCLATGPG